MVEVKIQVRKESNIKIKLKKLPVSISPSYCLKPSISGFVPEENSQKKISFVCNNFTRARYRFVSHSAM